MNFAAFLDWINGINDENDDFIQDSKWGTKAEDGSIRRHDSSSSNSIVATNWCIRIIEFCFLRRLNVWHEKPCCCCQHCDDVEWNLILIVRDFGVFFSSFDKERMVGSWKMHQSVSTPNRETCEDCHDFLGWRKIFILLQKRILMNLWKVRPSLDYDCDSYRNIFSLRNFTHSVFISVQQKLEKLQTHIDIVERQWQLHYDSITNCIQYT